MRFTELVRLSVHKLYQDTSGRARLELARARGLVPLFPPHLLFDAVIHRKTSKERRLSGLSHGRQGSWGGTAPVHGQEPRCAQHRLPVPPERQMWQVSMSQQ